MSEPDEGFSTGEVLLKKWGFYQQGLTGRAVPKHSAVIVLLLYSAGEAFSPRGERDVLWPKACL